MWCDILHNTIDKLPMNTYYVPGSVHLEAQPILSPSLLSVSHLPTLMNAN